MFVHVTAVLSHLFVICLHNVLYLYLYKMTIKHKDPTELIATRLYTCIYNNIPSVSRNTTYFDTSVTCLISSIGDMSDINMTVEL